jgi:hypothetical protein
MLTSRITVILTKQFAKCLRELQKKGKKGKDALVKAQSAATEYQLQGKIDSLFPTKNGETRIPNAEKYELGDGYRLVVQRITPAIRGFLFVGSHEDTDTWLDNHKNYKWVQDETDRALNFVQVSDPRDEIVVQPSFDLESPESLLTLPLLRDITEEQWAAAKLSAAVIDYLKGITTDKWEQDPNAVVHHVERNADIETALLAADLLSHAHNREWPQMLKRLSIATGTAKIVDGEEAATAMLSPVNSEQFFTWDDATTPSADADWSEWMLFLHPEQKEFVVRDFAGPARLRGVSGSGKTCVMVHRARRLAKKYKEDILLVTLTESMKRLLDILVKTLCGAEAAFIKTSTMNALAEKAIDALDPKGIASIMKANDLQKKRAREDAVAAVRKHPAFAETSLARIPGEVFEDVIVDEIAFIRMRLLPDEYEQYLEMPRHGRKFPLNKKARSTILNGVNAWDLALKKTCTLDHEGVSQRALTLAKASTYSVRNVLEYRCVMVDEVQDLSQIEMQIVAMIPDAKGKRVVDQHNGLFLVGDGAQTIYRKGFALKHCGIFIGNRSFVLQKNYRNTREILQAAYGLISSYEFADVDEDHIATPTQPHLSSRHGERPFLVKAASKEDESAFVVSEIQRIINEQRNLDEANEQETATEVPICVIGFNPHDRERVGNALRGAKIKTVDLKQDVSWDNAAVKISTLESAKGHEFHAVFIIGVCQGVIPLGILDQSEWKREAARLYVAMTRARERLFLSYTSNAFQSPSVFLASIQSDCKEFDWKNGKLRPAD